MSKYAQIPANTFENLQMEAGIFCKSFNPATGEFTGLMGATTGGGSFATSPEFSDFGEDIDNCPENTMELKRKERETAVLSTTFVTLDAESIKLAMAGADIDSQDATHIIPRRDLKVADFVDVWWVGDYSNINNGSGAGYCAIHLKRALATSGFGLQTTKHGKGQMAMELTGHYTIENTDDVPYEVYIKEGTDSGDTPEILLEKHSMTVEINEEVPLNVIRLVPAGSTITWASSASGKASVTNGVVKGLQAGSTTITASITVNSVTYSDTCTVVVPS